MYMRLNAITTRSLPRRWIKPFRGQVSRTGRWINPLLRIGQVAITGTRASLWRTQLRTSRHNLHGLLH
jgi:hypothetical protein